MRIPVIALTGASSALALALSAGVQAHEPEKSTSPETSTTSSGATVTTTTAAAMIVVRDKATGALRRATPEEMEKLISSGRGAQAARAPVEPYEIRAPRGQRAMALGDAGMSNQVARRNAQGGIDEVCVGDEGVAKAMSTPVAKAKAHE